MIDSLATALPMLIVVAAIVKRSEMSIWLAIIAIFSTVVGMSGASVDSLMVFFVGANFILMLAGFASWRISRNNLPLIIGILAAFDVVLTFSNLIVLLNTGSLSYNAGLMSGFIAYLQLVLVCTLNDSKGVLNELFDDARDIFHSVLHLGGDHKHDKGYK